MLSFLARKSTLLLILLLGLVLHMGTAIKGGLYADDYIHAAIITGSPELEERGLIKGMHAGTLEGVLKNQFNFFRPDRDNFANLRDIGVLPWWLSNNAQLHFFRPMASLTHWLDYQLWPENTHLMHAHNLVWYMLGLLVIVRFYQVFGLQKAGVAIALLLVVLDNSVYQVVTWTASRSMLLALVFGFSSLLCYHKSLQDNVFKWSYYLLGLLLLLLAALSAEAVVAICAYYIAYVFCWDQRSLASRLKSVIPYALVVIAWRLVYQAMGYGAMGVDFYVDPVHEPVYFLYRAITLLPANFFELLMGTDVLSTQLRPDLRAMFVFPGLICFLIVSALIWPLRKQHKGLVFLFVASCLALLPGLSITLSPRVMMIPFVGMAGVIASLFQVYCNQGFAAWRKHVLSMLLVYVLVVHVLLSFLLGSYMTFNAIKSAGQEPAKDIIKLPVNDVKDKRLVFLNVNRPFWLAFLPYQLAYQQQPLPASTRVMATSFYPLEVTRLKEDLLQIRAMPGFQYDVEPLSPYHNRMTSHFAYLTQELLGLIRRKTDAWHVGDEFLLPDMKIQITGLYKGKPQLIRVQLLEPLDDYVWIIWDMSTFSYRQLELPAVEESLHLEGFFKGEK